MPVNLSIDVVSISNPKNATIIDIKRLHKYSILACPYGWSLSAGLPVKVYPTTVRTFAPESERLFNESAIIDTLPVKSPIISFTANYITFAIMPMKPANLPTLMRV